MANFKQVLACQDIRFPKKNKRQDPVEIKYPKKNENKYTIRLAN